MFELLDRAMAVSIAGLVVLVMAVPALAAIMPSEPQRVKSLDGKWRFRLEQASLLTGPVEDWNAKHPIDTPATFEPFYEIGYKEDGSWHDIAVPGTWEMAGYSPATYNQPDNAIGNYRKWFEVPAAWVGGRVMVNFDGVMCGCEVWLNGQAVKVSEPSWGRENYHESGWTAWQADLTPHVKFGQRNLLALRVTKNTRSSDLDSGDYFFLGGVYRPVTLFTVPETHIQDLTVATKLLDGGDAEVGVAVKVAGDSARSAGVTAILEGQAPAEGKVGPDGQAEVLIRVSHPKLWSAEHPNLLKLTVQLHDAAGKVTQEITRRVGIREVSIRDGVLLVNGVPVKLTGICRHDLSAEEGTSVGPGLWRKDLELMKAANVNAVRTSHYPYGSGFYDLCDEMGFYVIDELPYCWCPTDDEEMQPAFLQRARETVARDKNHPSVIIWAVGNENKPGRNTKAVADLVKQMDATRPRLVSWENADVCGVEFDDAHYTAPKAMQQAADNKERRAKWPKIYTENPNVWDIRLGADPGCLDIWAQVLKRTWDVVWAEDGITGSFLWEWQDRGVCDKCPTKLYHVDPETGVQYLKVKGIVDGFRNPRPDYYHLKMVYSPIKVGPDVDLKSKPGSAVLDVTNHYSFTDPSDLEARWRLTKAGRKIASGTARLALAPRTSGKVALPLPSTLGEADTLRVDFDQPGGLNIISAQFAIRERIKAAPAGGPLSEDFPFPRLNLVVNVTRGDKAEWVRCLRYRGKLVNATVSGTSSRNTGANAGAAGSIPADTRRVDADITLEPDEDAGRESVEKLKKRMPKFEQPELRVPVGHVRAEMANGLFHYQIEWTGKTADVQELGWAFEMPKSFDTFTWDRQALWSVYPDTHIGRPSGSARPDSARVPLTKITRPDAYDFTSTKYDCNWASLTDALGKGLLVEFSPDDQHHVKCGFAAGGGHELVVNKQCSPPRDISTHSVTDLYLELEPGDKIEGSFRLRSAEAER